MATTSTTSAVRQDLEFHRGDAADFLVTVTDDATPASNIDLSVAVDGTVGRPAILIFGVKEKPKTQSNAAALMFKESYYADEITVLDQTTNPGEARILIDEPDTKTAKVACYAWELVVIQQDALRTGASAGTGTVALDSTALVGVATAFTKAKVGDVIHITSGAHSGKQSRITEITDDLNIVTERVWDAADTGFTFEIRRGKGRTAAFGDFNLLQDVVR